MPRAGRNVFVVALAVYLLTTGGSMATDTMSYEVSKGIVEQGTVAMSQPILALEAHRGIDGRYYSPYGLGHAFYSVPFYWLGRTAEVRLGLSVGRSEAVRKAAFVVGSAVAAALLVWVTYLFAWRWSGQSRASAATACTLAFATLLWPYSKFGFNAPLAALAVVGGVYAAWAGVRAGRSGLVVLGGASFGFALLVRPELALAGAVTIAWAMLQTGSDRRRLVATVAQLFMPMLIAVGVMLTYNYVRFGDIWDSGYLRDSTATFNRIGAMWEGGAGLLVSPGRSVFLYSPVAALGLLALIGSFRRDRLTAWLLASVSLALFLFYASLEYWDADRLYGPRYLLTILPLLIVPLVHWFGAARRPRVLPWVLALSVLVQIPGIAVDFTKALPALDVTHPLLERRWNWQVAGIVLNTRAFARYAPDNIRYVTGLATPPVVRPPEGRAVGFSDQFGYSLDFWWLYLFYLGKVSALTAVALAAGLAGTAATAAWRLRRRGQTGVRPGSNRGQTRV